MFGGRGCSIRETDRYRGKVPGPVFSEIGVEGHTLLSAVVLLGVHTHAGALPILATFTLCYVFLSKIIDLFEMNLKCPARGCREEHGWVGDLRWS